MTAASAAMVEAQPEPLDFLTVEEAARLLRIGRNALYEFVAAEDPPWAHRFGRTIRISRTGLLEWSRGNSGTALKRSR